MVPGNNLSVQRMNERAPKDRTNDPVRVRVFHYPQDYPAVDSLWRSAGRGIQLGRSDQETEILKKLKRDGDLFLVAERAGQIVGAVLGGYDGRRGMVYHLAVEASFRGQGIGRALMTDLEERLRAKGCLKVYLLVTKENLEAIKFYEEFGWEKMDLFIYGREL